MQRLKTEIRDRICAAALEEFKENGYADASIRKISERAGISLGNIYRYFVNKEALYFAVVQPFRNAIKEFLEIKYQIRNIPVADLAKDILEFIYEHESEFDVVSKGRSHYETSFIEFLVDMTAVKINRIVNSKMAQFDKKIISPDFYKIIAQSFLTAMFDVLKESVPKEKKLVNLTELMVFYFGQVGRD